MSIAMSLQDPTRHGHAKQTIADSFSEDNEHTVVLLDTVHPFRY